MKRLLCALLCLALLCAPAASFAESPEDDAVFFEDAEGMPEDGDFEDEDFDDGDFDDEDFDDEGFDDEEETPWVEYDYKHITVGNPTPMKGQFFTDLFGNVTSDTDVRQLVNGYNLVTWDGNLSRFRFDRSVVSGAVVTDDENGDRIYNIVLYNNLYYSDGVKITAQDYAFSILLQCSPLLAEIGGRPARFEYLAGFEAYIEGKASALAGVRVLNDHQLIIRVKAAELPYFHELARLAFYPYPMHVIAPGCSVRDDGAGVYLAGPFTAELLRETVLDPQRGYLTYPSPVSGPYCLLSYAEKTAEFEINPYYKGNENGKKPRIKRITYTYAEPDTMMEKLGQGEFTLLNKVLRPQTIIDGIRLVQSGSQYTQSGYPRIGLTYLYFIPDSPLIQDANVRRAIAHCLNKEAFVQASIGQFGMQADGLYGLGQWMYQLITGTMEYPVTLPENPTKADEAAYAEELAAWEEITMDGFVRYEQDTEKAAALLEEAGWTLNEQGQPFNPASDTVRCRAEGDKLIALKLKMGVPSLSDTSGLFETYLIRPLADAGVSLELVPMQMDDIAQIHNEHTSSDLDLLYLGDNFSMDFSPALFFVPEESEAGQTPMQQTMARLYELARDMNHTQPDDLLTYMRKWVTFQEELTDQLPLIPIYINVYFDFYTRELHNYQIEGSVSWAEAIVEARMYKADDENMMALEVNENEIDLFAIAMNAGKTEETLDGSQHALSTYPQAVRDSIPKEYNVINEFVTSSMSEDVESIASMTVRFEFETMYTPEDTVYLLFGVIRNGKVDWMVREGSVSQDGSVNVTLEKEQLEQLAGQTFALAVVSR